MHLSLPLPLCHSFKQTNNLLKNEMLPALKSCANRVRELKWKLRISTMSWEILFQERADWMSPPNKFETKKASESGGRKPTLLQTATN